METIKVEVIIVYYLFIGRFRGMAQFELVKLEIGEKIDQWVVEDKLGEGGFGSVYKVGQ